MKLLVFFAVFLLFVDLSVQLPKLVNCTDNDSIPTSIMESCGEYTCSGTNIAGVSCGVSQCLPGTQTGYKKQDDSKTYPDCCGGPICASE